MVKDTSFHKKVADHWATIPPIHFLLKLLNIFTFMAKGGRSFFNKSREKLKKQKEVIVVLVNRMDDESVTQFLSNKGKLNDLLNHEESYWKQSAKIF